MKKDEKYTVYCVYHSNVNSEAVRCVVLHCWCCWCFVYTNKQLWKTCRVDIKEEEKKTLRGPMPFLSFLSLSFFLPDKKNFLRTWLVIDWMCSQHISPHVLRFICALNLFSSFSQNHFDCIYSLRQCCRASYVHMDSGHINIWDKRIL